MAKGGKLTKMLKKVQSIGRHSRPTTPRAEPDSLARPVYVGKARRRYMVGPDIIEHPLFQELVERDESDEITVACEVVLFEHLLWMLENADPQPDSLDELVVYICMISA
ncbi:hypothetical protein V2J09_012402 [Rumex salicifolius]